MSADGFENPQPSRRGEVKEDARDGELLDWLEKSPHSGFRIEYEGPHVGYSISTWDNTLLGGGNSIREALRHALEAARRAQDSSGKGEADVQDQ